MIIVSTTTLPLPLPLPLPLTLSLSCAAQDKYYQKLFTPAMYTQWGMDHAKTACLQERRAYIAWRAWG